MVPVAAWCQLQHHCAGGVGGTVLVCVDDRRELDLLAINLLLEHWKNPGLAINMCGPPAQRSCQCRTLLDAPDR